MLGLGLVGCAVPPKATEAPRPVHVAAADHDRMLELAAEVLRDHRFRIDRQDPRLGLVQSHPRIAASGLEPWHDDHRQPYRLQESTLNYQRRIVKILLNPDAADYTMAVQVHVQRRNHPPAPLTEANILKAGGAGEGRSDVRSRETEQGKEESFWRPIGRDHDYEQRLMQKILARAENRSAE